MKFHSSNYYTFLCHRGTVRINRLKIVRRSETMVMDAMEVTEITVQLNFVYSRNVSQN